jgi:hypothetical protein
MGLIPVTELKQWAYCERIVYYHRVMPAIGQATFKMREALAAQELVEGLEMRRGWNSATPVLNTRNMCQLSWKNVSPNLDECKNNQIFNTMWASSDRFVLRSNRKWSS